MPTSARRRGVRAAVGLGAALVLGFGGAAWAFWTTSGEGEASAATGELWAPANVVANAPMNSGTVSVAWDTATLSTGQPATGYFVIRTRDSDGAVEEACGTSSEAPITATSCADTGVADGKYHYAVTSLIGSWSALSANSPSVTVINDDSLPTVTVTSITPSPNGNGWINASPVTVHLSAYAGFGIASITYTVDGGAPTTVDSDEADVVVAGDGVHTVRFSAEDTQGSVSATDSVLIRIDRIAPIAPSAPVLTVASDSGVSSTDAITKVTTPTLTGTAESGATVRLFAGATLVGTGVASGGTYSIVSSTLANGVHTLTAQATDLAANTGPASQQTQVTIDTVAPVGTPAPVLAATSDSGSPTPTGSRRSRPPSSPAPRRPGPRSGSTTRRPSSAPGTPRPGPTRSSRAPWPLAPER